MEDLDLSEFLTAIAEQPEALAAELLWKKTTQQQQQQQPSSSSTSNKTATDHEQKKPPIHPVLLETTQQLFRRVEDLAKLYREQLEQGGNQQAAAAARTPSSSLSGLDELYLGGGAADKDDDDDDDNQHYNITVDTETLWGQVDLQNEALQSLLLKPSIRKLSKATKRTGTRKEIRLLDDIIDDNGDGDGGEQEDDNEEGVLGGPQNDDSGDDENGGEDDEDEERKRIQARMERAMADMDEEDEEERTMENKPDNSEEEEDVVDPAREGLRDGFFDLHEMEAWADEEEEYLPDSAYPDENPEDEEEKDKRSLHQRQRDGDVDDGSDEESDAEDLLFRKVSLVRRKKYRSEDEVEALYNLYGEVKGDQDEGDDEDDDVINMTAADIFGAPNKRIVDQWKKKSDTKKAGGTGDDDDDSWNDYDFNDKEDAQGPSAWNEDNDDDDNDGGEGESEDEQLPMKGGGEGNGPESGKKGKKSKLDAQTEELEKEMLAEKPWQMTGETSSTARPTNSLLEATPEFEVATKIAPVITVEHTKSLEDIIKERILSENFDDVIPRELPDVGWHAKRGELPEVSQEKSKLGLGELYEREYLKKVANYDVDAAEKESVEEKAKGEMKTLFANLCSKLDALSNYHFAPRPVEVDAEVRTVTKPAIAMEEVLPLHVSDARGVAPEEVYGSKRGRDGVLRTDSEMDQQQRKRRRASKKAARRKARKQKLADEKLISRLQPGMGLNNPYEKRKMQEELAVGRAQGKVITGKADDTGEYGSSGTFFKRMQEEAQKSIRGSSESKELSSMDQKRKSSNSSSFKL